MPENRYNPTTLTNMENSLLNQFIRIRSCLIDSANHTTAIAEGATIYPSETYQKNGSLRMFRSKSTSIKNFLLSASWRAARHRSIFWDCQARERPGTRSCRWVGASSGMLTWSLKCSGRWGMFDFWSPSCSGLWHFAVTRADFPTSRPTTAREAARQLMTLKACNGKASDSRGMRSLKYTRQDMVEDDSGRSRCNGYSYATPSSQAKSADSIASSHLESSIESTLSDDWVVREGVFIGVLPLTLSHLTSDMLWFKDARLDDGLVHTCIADGNTSRWQVIKKNVLNMACYDSHIVQAKARAFRLEPREGHGKLAVDGEKIDLCSIHGVVLQGKARVMTL